MLKLNKASVLIIRRSTWSWRAVRDFRRDFAYNFLLNERYVLFAKLDNESWKMETFL